jgi:hypothetical protein
MRSALTIQTGVSCSSLQFFGSGVLDCRPEQFTDLDGLQTALLPKLAPQRGMTCFSYLDAAAGELVVAMPRPQQEQLRPTKQYAADGGALCGDSGQVEVIVVNQFGELPGHGACLR